MTGLAREEAIRRIAAARAAGIGDAERAAWLFDAACDADAGLSPGQFHKPVSGGVSGGGGGMSCDGDG